MWRRYVAYGGVVAASMGGAWWSGHTAGRAGARAARQEVAHQLVRGCERSNARVRESNRRALNHERQDEAIELIARTARTARMEQLRQGGGAFNEQAADGYARAVRLVRAIHFAPLPLTDCRAAYRVR